MFLRRIFPLWLVYLARLRAGHRPPPRPFLSINAEAKLRLSHIVRCQTGEADFLAPHPVRIRDAPSHHALPASGARGKKVRVAYNLSTMVTLAMPPPSHMVCRP